MINDAHVSFDSSILATLFFTLVTLVIYQACAKLQQKCNAIWLNPMVLAIVVLVPLLLFNQTEFDYYYQHTVLLHGLLEPAVVALGFPLYQQLSTIRYHWRLFAAVLSIGALSAVVVSFIITMLTINLPAISVSLAYKAVTTPIGISLTLAADGNPAVTAFAIILAGLFGALWGRTWLVKIGVTSAKAQGLAIGAASHALGTATISKISYEHGAYGSLALIVSAVITAIIGPALVGAMLAIFI